MLINSTTSEHQQHHNHATTNQLPPPSNHHHHSILLSNHSTNTCSDKTPSSTLNMTHHDDIPMSDVAAIQSNNRNSMPPPSSSLFTQQQQQQQNTNHTTGGSILDILSSQSHSTTHHTHTSRINARKSLDPSVLANATTAHMVSSSNNANNIMMPSQQQTQNGVSHSSSDYYHQDSHSATTAFSPRFSRQFSQPPLFHMMNNNSTTLANTQQQQQQQGTTQEASLSDDEEGSTSQTNGSSSNAANGSSRRVNYACTECRKAHKACSGERPCDRCKKLGMEDKCKSSVRKKRILTKRYWVHFMSNGTSGGNSTTMTSSDMMDDNSVQSPATNVSQQHQSFPNLNLNVVNSASSNNPRSSSMNYKRHSSATLPSYNSIRRLNAGLSGGSSTSLTSNSELNDNVSNTVMLMDSSDNNSNNRSPRQGPFYHPYKSPRMMNPSEQQLQQQQNSTNQESMHLDNTNRHGHSQTSSPRGGHHASTMNVSSPFTNSQLQPQSMYPSQQPSMTAVPISSTAFNNTTVSSTAGSSSYPSFPGLEAYKLDQPSPNSALTTNNHMNQTSSTSNPQQQVDPQQQQQHLHPRSLSATSAASSSLGYHHGKSLSDSNLLPPPSSLLYNNSGSTTTSTSPNISHLSNTSLHSTTTASPFGGVSESTITSSGYLNHSNNNGTGLHIPPILLGDEQQPNTTQIQHQAHHSHHSSPQQLHPQLSPYPQQWSSQQGNVNNNTTPSSNTSSTTATPRGLMFYGNNGSANDLVNSPRASSDYLYSPRSDYSSDFSSLTNSPRFGAGGTDSNSSTPRGLIGSMSGMNINENMEASQQPFNPFSVTNSQLNTLSTQPNNNNSNGTQRYRGQRSSAQFHHQQLSYDSALNVSGTRKSIAGYLNHAGNRYSLGSFAYSQFHGSAYSNPSTTTTTTTSNNYGSGNPQINISSETSGNNGILPNNMAPNKRHSQHFSNNPHNRYSLGPNHELHGLTMNQSANSNSNISGNTQSNNHTPLHPTTK